VGAAASRRKPAVPEPITVARVQLYTRTATIAEWVGDVMDGRAIYARYKGGVLRVGIGADINAAAAASVGKKPLAVAAPGCDGLTYEQLRHWTNGVVDWPGECGVYGR
jgi:hypothetical protein